MSSAQPLTCGVQMCLPYTDAPAGCSPEAGILGDETPRRPCSPLALCGPGQATGLPVTHCREEGPSPGCLGVRPKKDRGMWSPGSCLSMSQFRRQNCQMYTAPCYPESSQTHSIMETSLLHPSGTRTEGPSPPVTSASGEKWRPGLKSESGSRF